MKLKEWIRRNGVKRIHIARTLSMAKTTLLRIIERKSSPSLFNALRISHITNGKVSLDELLSTDDTVELKEFCREKWDEEV